MTFVLTYHQPPFPPEEVGEFISLNQFERLIKGECDTLLEESPTGPDDVAALTEWQAKVVCEWPAVTSIHHAYTYPGEKNSVGHWVLTERP